MVGTNTSLEGIGRGAILHGPSLMDRQGQKLSSGSWAGLSEGQGVEEGAGAAFMRRRLRRQWR